ncbi:DUF1593 domain-containing protein [Solirubrobacter phytolaccae]|uniref:DUF1593 domain-containing protein n=1 Tax=Solirubrobacter phytolaccae TaxID=1404360 RepID=A0A9X3SE59_9ACTN|nr:DUF1593 domain-containing protein [Solirubrobacter phytolaccae]MDA0180092.1 DUF1593 domain-containing protein [Solirubrobacter phytolaccae]
MTRLIVLFALAVFAVIAPAAAQAQTPKPRAVLLLDPELDDQNTLIRYLLYANELDTQGILYQSSGVHWAGDGKGTLWSVPGREYASRNLCPCTSWRWKEGERFIDEAVDLYEQVYPNLKVHNADYPAPADLRSKIYKGNIEFDTDISKDTAGSNRIKELLLDDNPARVYLLTGAGHSSVARALKSIKQQYEGTPQWPAIYEKVVRKAYIQSWGDQDNTYATYIRPNWPDVYYRNMSAGVWGYGARNAILPADRSLLDPAWMKANVSDVGPFGSFYRVWGDGKQMVPGDIFDFFGFSGLTAAQLTEMGYAVWTGIQAPGAWISEGDTPIFMNQIDNGLRAGDDPSYGGWAGRSAQDVNPATGTPNNNYASARWFRTAQNDFAARMKWTVTPTFAGANHEPVVSVNGPLNVTAAPGETVKLEGLATDPDGHALTFKWWQYTDADTYPGAVVLNGSGRNVSFEVPANSVVPVNAVPGQTIHLILEVTDDGTPAMTSYQRVVVTVSARTTQYAAASVAPVLSVSVGAAPNFGALVPGTAKVYTATSTATVTSTAGEAVLSIHDISPLSPGKLVNGSHALASPIKVNGGTLSGSPLTVKTYPGPATSDVTTLTFEQPLAATDTLRTGSYSKSLTYTLATTTP